MADLTLPDIAKKLADIDFAMLFTRTEGGELAGRPMSNNGEVEYEGTSYYFTWADSRMVSDIEREPKVGLSFQGSKGLLPKPPIMVAVEGVAEIVRDVAAFEAHWDKSMNRWFKDGPSTPGVAMIKVVAKRIHYWDGEDEGEVKV